MYVIERWFYVRGAWVADAVVGPLQSANAAHDEIGIRALSPTEALRVVTVDKDFKLEFGGGRVGHEIAEMANKFPSLFHPKTAELLGVPDLSEAVLRRGRIVNVTVTSEIQDARLVAAMLRVLASRMMEHGYVSELTPFTVSDATGIVATITQEAK